MFFCFLFAFAFFRWGSSFEKLTSTMERVSLKNYNLKIYCCIYPHYEIVFLMIWVQYRNLNLRSSLHGISEKDFLRLELAHKSCMLSPSGNRTVNILCYLSAKKVFICKTHSAFTINTPSNKRPIKKLKKSLHARGLYSKYYVWNLQDCNSFIFLWPRDFSETYDICYNYVVKSAKWICKKSRSSQTFISCGFWRASWLMAYIVSALWLLFIALRLYRIVLIRRICMRLSLWVQMTKAQIVN